MDFCTLIICTIPCCQTENYKAIIFSYNNNSFTHYCSFVCISVFGLDNIQDILLSHFCFQQTFIYTLSEHLYLLVLFYSIPALAFQYFTKKTKLVESIPETQNESIENKFISTVVVSDGHKKQSIIVSEILYFSANPPYINIHLESKKYLHNETLRSVSLKLKPEQFVRVHKSTIVNIKMVASFTTRLNGDYDLTMKNNVTLRLSRNFASDFKSQFNKTHHLTTK